MVVMIGQNEHKAIKYFGLLNILSNNKRVSGHLEKLHRIIYLV